MQNTSALWKQLWAGGDARLETVAVINGVEYGAISNPVVNRALMQDGLSVGNTVSATCAFAVRGAGTIPRAAQVAVKMRLTDGASTTAWYPVGTFFVSHRTRDAVTGLLTLECYDALLKGNAEFPLSGAWPRSMAALAAQLASALGVAMDARTSLRTGDAYMMDKPDAGTSINELLGKIGAANGGNWIITPANQLRLVPITSAANAQSAQADVVDVLGALRGIDTGSTGTITGIRYAIDNQTHITGDETDLVLDADVTVPAALELAEWAVGLTYQAFDLKGAVYDPAAELGDYLRAGANGEIRSVLISESATLGLAFRGDIGAPEPGELADEYPYLAGARKAIQVAKAYVNSVTGALDDSLDQAGIFNRLTNNGQVQGLYMIDGQLYVNMSYARSGTLVLGGQNNQSGVLEVRNGSNAVIGSWEKDGIVLNGGTIRLPFSMGELDLNYAGTPLKYHVDNGNGSVFDVKFWNFSADFRLNNDATNLAGQYIIITGPRENKLKGLTVRQSESNQTTYTVDLTVPYTDSHTVFRCYNNKTNSHKIDFYGNGNGEFWGNLSCHGTKNRVVSTDQYSDRLLYCYETPSPMFGDVGEGVIGEDGLCHVWLDPVFAQTIATGGYQVFLQKYGDGDCWVKARRGACFIVEGTPGLAFGWELKARQADYDQRRLDKAEQPYSPPEQTYGADAAQYIEQLRKERIPE